MRTAPVALPTLAFVVVTRAALAAGIALLVADKLPRSRRRAIGTALAAIGAATTIPAAVLVSRAFKRARLGSALGRDRRLIGATRFPRKGDDIF